MILNAVFKSLQFYLTVNTKQDSVETAEPTSPQKSSDSSQQNRLSFQQGQVYYSSIAKQVHVYPNSQNSCLEAAVDNRFTEITV